MLIEWGVNLYINKLENLKYCQRSDQCELKFRLINLKTQMQKPDLNQQRGSYRRKRKCIFYKPNDYFENFDRSQHELIINYQKQAETHMVKSLSILINNIRKSAKPLEREPPCPIKGKPQSKDILISFAKNAPNFIKDLPQTILEEDEHSNPEKQIQDMIVFQKTGKKTDKSLKKMNVCKEQREVDQNPVQVKKHMTLEESMKKLLISNEQEELEKEIENIWDLANQSQNEDNNLLETDQKIKNKPLSQLLLFSKKIQKKQPYSPIESQDSEYQVTDHSSNQSSNDEGDYEERFAFDSDEKPLFGTIFAQGGKNYKPSNGGALKFANDSNDSNFQPPPKLNFKPILDSPKKSNTKKKRLYVNKKKVPRWAEDLKEVAKVYGSQHQRNLRTNFKQIIGNCIVVDLQTNPIFNINDTYVRSSTVKWNHNCYDA